MMKEKFNARIREARDICILGHISPDGDCVGSTLALYNYIREYCPEKKVRVYLEESSEKFAYMEGFSRIVTENAVDHSYGLCIVCDCGDAGRTGRFLKYLQTAEKSFMIDHHVTNEGFCDDYVIRAEASSTCEIVYDLLYDEYITKPVAECIYTGIIHDTGVFKYSSTSPHTMEIAGRCMEKGISFGRIIDDSFYSMTYKQRVLLGAVLQSLEPRLSGAFHIARLSQKTMRDFGILSAKETDGFIDLIRNIDGASGGAFFYQLQDGTYKASLRSNTDDLDVSVIAKEFGGGGHKRAAGCLLSQNYNQDIEEILRMAAEQLSEKHE